MASVDHTIICFHNGKLMDSLYSCNRPMIGDSLIPFHYSRDGRLMENRDRITWHVDPEDYKWSRWQSIRNRREANALKKGLVPKYGYLLDCHCEIYLYESAAYNVIFYFSPENTYVMIGGYGHMNNPYTHFYGRGYGEDFERKMAFECYEWLCEDVLNEVVMFARQITWMDKQLDYLIEEAYEILGYKNYYDRSADERLIDYIDYDPETVECANNLFNNVSDGENNEQ